MVDDSIFESVKLSTEIDGSISSPPPHAKSAAVAIKRAKTLGTVPKNRNKTIRAAAITTPMNDSGFPSVKGFSQEHIRDSDGTDINIDSPRKGIENMIEIKNKG